MNRRGEAPRRIDAPEAGFFKTRLVRGGPFVAARIVCRLGFWSAEIDGRSCGSAHSDPVLADGVMGLWTSGVRITEDEYRHMLHRPVALDPQQAIDVRALPPVF